MKLSIMIAIIIIIIVFRNCILRERQLQTEETKFTPTKVNGWHYWDIDF